MTKQSANLTEARRDKEAASTAHAREKERLQLEIKEAEKQMRKVSGLVFLDWERIKRESGSPQKSSEERSISACKRTIATLKSHLKNNEQARNFLVVNLSLATVIYIHMDPAGGTM